MSLPALGIAAEMPTLSRRASGHCSTSEEKQLNVALTKLANEVLPDPKGNAQTPNTFLKCSA
jgi:hypothetical protein